MSRREGSEEIEKTSYHLWRKEMKEILSTDKIEFLKRSVKEKDCHGALTDFCFKRKRHMDGCEFSRALRFF